MTTKATKSQTRLGLYVTEKRDGDFYHVNATVVVIGTTAYERKRIDAGERVNVPYERIRNINDSREDSPLYLENFRVSSQGNANDETRHLYGYECRYHDVYAVDRYKAERMARTLAIVEKRLEKLTEKYGHPASFGAYLARVAEAIGATAIVRPHGKQYGWSYSDNEHRVLTVAEGIYHVDGLVRAWETERERADQERQREAQSA
jgi:hypothetical protein